MVPPYFMLRVDGALRYVLVLGVSGVLAMNLDVSSDQIRKGLGEISVCKKVQLITDNVPQRSTEKL